MTHHPPRLVLRGLLALLVCAAGCNTPAKQKKVLLIGLDGVRVDILAQAHTPNIDALIADGTFSDRATTRHPTVSGPGWSSMLIGAWADKHGVLGNDFSENDYATYPDFLTRLEQHDPTFETYAVVDWLPLGTDDSGGPLISPAVDSIVAFDGYIDGYADADARTAELAAEYLRTGDPDAAFVYFGNIDVVGHDTHSLSHAYRAAIEEADGHVGTLLAALRARPAYASEDWLILMSTDHGRRDDGGHGEPSLQERTIFYLASGPSARKGTPATAPSIVDVAVTALAHLGVPLDPAWQLDGQAVGLAQP